MRSVRFKILFWCGGILVLWLLAYLVSTRFTTHRVLAKDGDLGALIALQFKEASRIYRTEGNTALRDYLETLNSAYPQGAYYLVHRGRDVVTGEDRSSLLRKADSAWSVLQLNTRMVFAYPSPESDDALIVISGRNSLARYIPFALVLTCGIALLGSALTLQLASPLRQLAGAVERFGSGELSVRVQSQRRDEIGEVARAFDRMADRIETLVTAERRLLQDISHELRSPLTRLRMAAKLVGMSNDLEAEKERIHKEVTRIVSLVDNLLQVTRAEGDTNASNLEPLPVTELLGEVIEDCRIEASQRSIELVCEGPGCVSILADEELVRRAVENVVRNAIQHSPNHQRVEIIVSAANEDVTISVRDYGSGVPPKDLANIFRPFFRVEESRDSATGGVGLGLAIAARAVQVHSGKIWAENAGPGLRVSIHLPLDLHQLKSRTLTYARTAALTSTRLASQQEHQPPGRRPS